MGITLAVEPEPEVTSSIESEVPCPDTPEISATEIESTETVSVPEITLAVSEPTQEVVSTDSDPKTISGEPESVVTPAPVIELESTPEITQAETVVQTIEPEKTELSLEQSHDAGTVD